MNMEAMVSAVIAVAAALGGFVGGRQTSGTASETVTMLRVQVEELRLQCSQIPALLDRIAVLEELVTQRAEVEKVLQIVTEIKEKLNDG